LTKIEGLISGSVIANMEAFIEEIRIADNMSSSKYSEFFDELHNSYDFKDER
jgi:hypothetical protein